MDPWRSLGQIFEGFFELMKKFLFQSVFSRPPVFQPVSFLKLVFDGLSLVLGKIKIP